MPHDHDQYHLRFRQDLVAFYGVLNNVIAKWDTMAALLHTDPGIH